MKVCYFGTYRANYIRNRLMIERLRRNGVEVIECHEQLWHGIEDRVQAARGGLLKPSFWWRIMRAYVRLLQRYRQIGEYDVLIVGYPGQLDVLLARLLSWQRHKPLVWDILMSVYLIAVDRGISERLPSMWLIRWLERVACRLPDLLIMDTGEYARWFQLAYEVPLDRFRFVPLGADDSVFVPPALAAIPRHDEFRVIYYGTFIPNHGVPYMIEAAHLLAAESDIHFEFIGKGPDRARVEEVAGQHELTNVTFVDWLEPAELVKRLARADVCLGALGLEHQSRLTVHNKIYEGLALGKPVITGDSPAVREFFEHGKQVYLCTRGDAQALAEAIRALRRDESLRQTLSREGQACFQRRFSMNALGLILKQHLIELVSRKAASNIAPAS